MKKRLLLTIVFLFSLVLLLTLKSVNEIVVKQDTPNDVNEGPKLPKKTPEQRALYTEERAKYEFKLQRNPNTGEIPKDEKIQEFDNAKKAKIRVQGGVNSRAADAAFISRGPDNLGGRTRAFVVDRSDNTGNTMIAGGVSSGVFRTTDGGASWTKVSSNNEIHNVTCIIQDPRSGFENVWYYGTGEALGNSTSLGSLYLGRGIWQSTDGGLTWSQFAGTNSTQESFDSTFDMVFNLAIDPTTGYLFAAVVGQVLFYLPTGAAPPNPAGWYNLKSAATCCSTSQPTDIAITTGGRIYASIGDRTSPFDANRGVWATNSIFTPAALISGGGSFNPSGRTVLALSPSNQNKLYVLFDNGINSSCAGLSAPEADLWMWDQSASGGAGAWTDYSSKLPDETGCLDGNDPFAIQNGYDLVVSVKPDNENFVVIGGTNAYKIADITGAGTFTRIGGYNSASNYALYDTPGGAEHHPDIHAMVFSPFNNNILFTGTDGGIHKTNDVTAGTVDWINLNNNYVTQQYYHVAIDPQLSSDYVIGGLQDNGTNEGGTSAGQPNLTNQVRIWGGDGVAVGISRDAADVPVFHGFQAGPIYRAFRDNFTWANITPTGSSSQFVTYFYLDPDNNKTLYYVGQNRLYRTNNSTNVTTVVGAGGTDWTDMSTAGSITGGSATEYFSVLSTPRETYNSGTSYLLMGTDEGNIYRLNDPQNASDITGATKITPGAATGGVVTGLAVHPTNRDIVLATYSNYGVVNIFLTTNATAPTPTWTTVERNLSAHSIRSSAIVEANGETMYLVGTARGLYSSLDPTSQDWIREAPNLIGFAVVSSMAYRPVDGKLLIGTHGNGMFEATITQVLGLEESNFSKSISIYPNPVKDVLRVNLTNNLGASATYKIHSLLGQMVTQGELKDERIDVNNLNPGLYFLEITSEGKRGIKRFIKQ